MTLKHHKLHFMNDQRQKWVLNLSYCNRSGFYNGFAFARGIKNTYCVVDESFALLETGGSAASVGDAVEPVGRRVLVAVSVSALDAVDAEHEEGSDDGRDAGGEERGRVPPRAVVDPAWREGKGLK